MQSDDCKSDPKMSNCIEHFSFLQYAPFSVHRAIVRIATQARMNVFNSLKQMKLNALS